MISNQRAHATQHDSVSRDGRAGRAAPRAAPSELAASEPAATIQCEYSEEFSIIIDFFSTTTVYLRKIY